MNEKFSTLLLPHGKKLFVFLGIPIFVLLLLGFRIDPSRPEAGRVLAVGVLMAFYWITEAIPLAATALIPVVLFPFLGIMKGREVAPVYFNSIIFLFIGGFIVALAMEKWNLHKRIALKIILTVGRSPSRLMLGFMLGTWLLSMWISNTATMMMMVPIMMALVLKLEEEGDGGVENFESALLLGIAYASSIGGMATLIGTPPNLAFVKIFAISFPGSPEVTFVGWLTFALPLSLVFFILTYFFLRLLFVKKAKLHIDTSLISSEYESLGRPSFEEKTVLISFLSLAVLWMTRSDIHIGGRVVRGWASLIGDPSYVDDGTVAIGIAVLLFLLPSRSERGFIMDWGTVRKLPWDIVILFGGGFALAKGFHDSGLSELLGEKLSVLRAFPPLLMILSVCALITFLTELTSNTATTQVVLPIIASLSVVLRVHPLFLMVPATISASCAFMLPVATPPNAIVFGTHRLRVSDMARTGFALNLIGILLVTLSMYFLGRVAFAIDPSALPS